MCWSPEQLAAIRRHAFSCLLLLLLLAADSSMNCLCSAYNPAMDANASQLSPSVLLMGEFDWSMSTGSDGKPWSRCLDSVWRARAVSTGDRLNFVPTHHWLPGQDGTGVSAFCYLHTTGAAGDRGTCLPFTSGKIAEFRTSMTYCFAEAIRQGFVPYVRPHLDDGLNRGVWRNSLLFGPTDKHSNFSFADVMTVPLAEALRDALNTTAAEGALYTPPERTRPVVYVGLQGEMSATLMRFTSQWAQLVPTIRSIIGDKHADVKVGIGLNFNKLESTEALMAAKSDTDAGYWIGSGQRAAPTEPMPAADGQQGVLAAAAVPPIDSASVKHLLTHIVDFIGVSAYAPYTGPNFRLHELENSAFNCGDSLRRLADGVELADLVRAGKLELHYSEFGLGGGSAGNQKAARSALWAAREPWAGVAGPYNASRDPWQRRELGSFRQEFYSKVLQWLGDPNIKTYLVSEVFVWSMASWDVFGVYRESSSAAGTYRDAALAVDIAVHNTAVIGAKVCRYQGTAACEAFGSGKKKNNMTAAAVSYMPRQPLL